MRRYTNYKKENVFMSDSTFEHIAEGHPEISEFSIRRTLKDPYQVRLSTCKSNTELYYFRKDTRRYYCVVVKRCRDGNFISTALTTTKPKDGKIIYKDKE